MGSRGWEGVTRPLEGPSGHQRIFNQLPPIPLPTMPKVLDQLPRAQLGFSHAGAGWGKPFPRNLVASFPPSLHQT